VRISVVEDLEALPVFAAATHEQLDQVAKFAEEIEAIDGGPRMATSRAIEDTRVVVVNHRDFNNLLDAVPVIRDQVMTAMEERLERVDREEG
jgi:hypothetical protein